MKIISLHFKNLNSLKGEFKIDFSNPTLANAGLFAITGPTGAGKSTILDAISLALFSNTPRLGDINKNTIGEKGVIVTKGTKDAFAHICFEVNANIYKSEWSIYITNRNNWSDITHKLSILTDGEFIPTTKLKSETKNEIKRIIGLDENQFTKAIVLSQGKFDEFLRSDKNKRYELLEIITGTQIYRQIGIAVYQKYLAIDKELALLNTQLSGIEILSDDELKAIQDQYEAYKIQIHELKQGIQQLEGFKLAKEKIKQIEAAIDKNKQDEIKLNQDNADFTADLIKISNHEKALPLQGDFVRWQELHLQKNSLEKKISDGKLAIEALQQNKKNQIEELDDILKKGITENNFIEELEAFYSFIFELENNIRSAEGDIKNLQNFLNSQYQQIPVASTQKIKDFKTSVGDLNRYIDESEKALSLLDLPSDIERIGAAHHLDIRNKSLEILKDLIKIKSDLDKENVEANSLSGKSAGLQKAVSQLEQNLTDVVVSQKKLESEVDVMDSAFKANQSVLSLEDFRNKLEEGKPCPCCGSEVHPYASKLPYINSELEDLLAKKKRELKDVIDRINQLNSDIKVNVANSEGLKNQQLKTETSIKDLLHSWESKMREIGCDFNSTVVDLESQIVATQKTIEDVKLFQNWQETKQPLLVYVEQLKEYFQIKENLDKTKQEKAAKFKGDHILVFRDSLKQKWDDIYRNIESNKQAINDNESALVELSVDLNKTDTNLNAKVKELSLESISILKTLLLPDVVYTNLKARQKDLSERLVSISTTATTLQRELEDSINKDNPATTIDELIAQIKENQIKHDVLLQDQGAIANRIANNTANQATAASLQAQKLTLQKEYEYHSILNHLIGNASGDKFNNIIQRITLRQLFAMTNQRLLTLMDRYQVDLGGDGQEDEIWVIDTYMGDERRTINSVSGGERFVISLAMALALSDLASKNVKIDSMFIDEGFGSLSPDDLDNAITMLERMQVESEKTIGIISHVESLKERISTQIQVIKLQNGESTLRIKSNESVESLAV